ncbi:MAG: hypothetical protein ACTSP9_07210 [Promethearchaeota archaeon]
MSESEVEPEKKQKKKQSKTSRIIWGIVGIFCIGIGIFYILRVFGIIPL